MKKIPIIHPFLFALLPFLSLYSFYIYDFSTYEIPRSLILSLMSASILLLILKSLLKNWYRAGIICSLFLILFYSFGNAFFLLYNQSNTFSFSLLGFIPSIYRFAILWLVIFAIGVFMILIFKDFEKPITKFLNVVAVIALVIPLYNIMKQELLLLQPRQDVDIEDLDYEQVIAQTNYVKPDIYYIILDGYGRMDILDSYYQYDNSQFVDFLHQKGFYVANESFSNYPLTYLSLASSLNMSYLELLPDSDYRNLSTKLVGARLIRWNFVQSFLESQGYQMISFASGYRMTELINTDVLFRPPQKVVSSFEKQIIETSALMLLRNITLDMGMAWENPGYEAHRQKINFIFDNLGEISKLPSTKFVFAHIVAPHPPFVFDSNGQPTTPDYGFTLSDADDFPGGLEEYKRGYRSQLSYINVRTIQVINEILDKSASPPIIIIQADHGPRSLFHLSSSEQDNLVEGISILNAYYLPGKKGILYAQISPVNTFRIIFNNYFDTNYPILQDINYSPSGESLYLNSVNDVKNINP